MPSRQRHCLPHKFAFSRYANISSQWKRRRRRSTEKQSFPMALSDRYHLLLLLLLPLSIFMGRTEGKDALGPDIQLEAVEPTREAEILIGPDIQLEAVEPTREAEILIGPDIQLEAVKPTREAELLIDEAIADSQQFEQKKSDGESVGLADPASFAHWHYSSAAFGGLHSDFFFIGAPSVQAHISRHSWEQYQRFKEETCRKSAETDLAERRLNSTESAYFHWEESEFHRELRKKLLPQTIRDGRTSFRALLNSELLGSLDPRLFVSAPKSLCKAKRLVDEADERLKQIKEEKHMFEDFLINKVLDPSLFAIPTKSNRRSNGTTKKTANGGGMA